MLRLLDGAFQILMHNGEMTALPKTHPKAREWRHRLLVFVVGLLTFETVTGLSIYLLPFSISNQVMVLLHTGVGLVFILPFAWYQLRHWRLYRQMPMTHLKLTGYFSMGATLVAAVSGLVLTVQAVFQVAISYGWDLQSLRYAVCHQS